MKVWLDDLRPMPEGYDIHVATADAAIAALKTKTVTQISLDHDLGDETEINCGTGYDVAKYIEEAAFFKEIPRLEVAIHSANPVGRDKMKRAITRADEYWDKHDARPDI